MTERAYETERWQYIGRRWVGGKILHYWLRPGATDPSAFEKLVGHAPGAFYDVQAAEDAEHLHVLGVPAFAENPDGTDERVAAWRTEDRGAEATRVRVQVEKRARRESGDLGDLTLRELKRRMTGPQAAGTLAAAIRYLGIA